MSPFVHCSFSIWTLAASYSGLKFEAASEGTLVATASDGSFFAFLPAGAFFFGSSSPGGILTGLLPGRSFAGLCGAGSFWASFSSCSACSPAASPAASIAATAASPSARRLDTHDWLYAKKSAVRPAAIGPACRGAISTARSPSATCGPNLRSSTPHGGAKYSSRRTMPLNEQSLNTAKSASRPGTTSKRVLCSHGTSQSKL
mmetsp:Transcript_90943/g.273159  ORF Transcript_90943/g.273159 Transcript_90943/m.273159 type:complete len:202 (+) Transcript_90943:1261-1866(+)